MFKEAVINPHHLRHKGPRQTNIFNLLNSRMSVFPFSKILSVFLLLSISFTLTAQRHAHYYLVFSGRDATLRPFSIGGHAFVSWGVTDLGAVITAEKSLGFFPGPESDMLDAMLTTKRGKVVKGYSKNSKGVYLKQFTVEVDSTVWVNTQCEADIWNYQPYNLFTRNCVHFMDTLAAMSGLKRPRTKTLIFGFPRKPVKYIKRLYGKNKRRAVRFKQVKFGAAVPVVVPASNTTQ